jgi:hypothetical protein
MVLEVQGQVDCSIISSKVMVFLTITNYEAYSDVGELQCTVSVLCRWETESMEISQ